MGRRCMRGVCVCVGGEREREGVQVEEGRPDECS